MRKLITGLALMLALVVGMMAQVVLAQSDTDAETDPEALVLELADAWNSGDLEATAALYADDAVVEIFPPEFDPNAPYEGIEEIREWIEHEMSLNHQGTITIDEVDGNTVHSTHAIINDDIAMLGLDSVVIHDAITVEDGLVTSHIVEFSEESIDAITAAMAEMEEEATEDDMSDADTADDDVADDDMADDDTADDDTADDAPMMEENGCAALPNYAEVSEALAAVQDEENGGYGFDMWGTLVDRTGIVCLVTRTGEPGEQWPGSRVISAQKANTANAFSLPGLALSTGNLYNPTQPGSSLFGLQESNPVDPDVAYAGPATDWGTESDPMVGKRIGGVNVFGGGLALYNADGELLGALGVSGDSSCADHAIAWKLRDALELDYVPAGVSETGDDNMILDLSNGFGHPACGLDEMSVVPDLPETHPIE